MNQLKYDALVKLVGGHGVAEVVRAMPAFVGCDCGGKSESCGYFMVSWWGDEERPLPVGFTRFEFISPQGSMLSIMCYDEPKNYETLINPDEWIVIFRRKTWPYNPSY